MKLGILRLSLVAVMVLAVAAALFWQARQPGGEEVRAGYLRFDLPEATSHFDLLFSEQGSISYNFIGESVNLYIAHYHRDQLVLHELVAGVSRGGAAQVNGQAFWGITTQGGERRELRAKVTIDGAASSSYFDFSQAGFEVGSMAGGAFVGNGLTSVRIQPGERYILHLWQTGRTFWADGDHFLPERLRENEKTAILYVVFG